MHVLMTHTTRSTSPRKAHTIRVPSNYSQMKVNLSSEDFVVDWELWAQELLEWAAACEE